ncbi:hypothetical protein FGG08_003248 [Glutinoglossum americanum]|uniref:Thiol methyltransferase n=1 Tax=Glutinoglossum americanum TaxID=1670608 RepID=A0A9P8KYA4_9PEZI|nr:hypothetical protein FGG08_003248 [Glutinoglossum americanum]
MDRVLLQPRHQLAHANMSIHPLSAARARLLEHFSVPDSTFGERWALLWDAGDFLPWDKGTPNPALEDLLENRKDLLGGSVFVEGESGALPGEKRRKRALVPGCGRGYDVLLLASYGYDAYGLEISDTAVKLCEEYASEHGKDYPARDESIGVGKVKFILGDFFKEEWEKEVEGAARFELLYDYTFLSALPPSTRPAWSLRYSQLLSSSTSGCLICIEYPTYKDPATRGPPFGLPPKVYLGHLSHPGEELPYDEEGSLLENQIVGTGSTASLERIAHWQPERTHEIGKGTDWVSVWRHI